MSLQFDLFTNRARLVSPDAPARSASAEDVTVEQPSAGAECWRPICGKCGGEKTHYPKAKWKQRRLVCRPCETAARKEWRRRVGERRDRDAPHKRVARAAVNNALRAGRLKKGPCQTCGTTANIQAHHDDYSAPLDVMWLCPSHHRDRHRYLDSLQA